MPYRTVHMIRHHLPDDRLAHLTVGDGGVITFAYRAWRIHPALVRDMHALSASVAESGVYELADGPVMSKVAVAWFQTDQGLAVPLAHRVSIDGGVAMFEMRARADMIDPALLRELNEFVLPEVCGMLMPS